MLYLSKKKNFFTPLMLWQFFSFPGIENGIEYRYFSRYRIEVRNSSIVTTLVHSGEAPSRPPHVTLYKIHLFETC